MSDSGDSLAGPGFLPAPPPAETAHIADAVQPARIAQEAEIAPPGPGRGPGGGEAPPTVDPSGDRADEALPLRIMDHALTGAWALRSFLELGTLPGAVPCARLHARLVLREWELTVLSEDIELLVSELVTNGLQASRNRRATFLVIAQLMTRDTSQATPLAGDDGSPH